MKTLNYSIEINKSCNFIFNKLIDKATYPHWAKAWGEGMTCDGVWDRGEKVSFCDATGSGTRAIIEELIPNEFIKMKHVAVVDHQDVVLEPSDDEIKRWIGAEESYHLKKINYTKTILEVVVYVDESYESMMNGWSKALQYLKELCES